MSQYVTYPLTTVVSLTDAEQRTCTVFVNVGLKCSLRRSLDTCSIVPCFLLGFGLGRN
ncbi:MAG: hypothetical protein SWZ49_03185 [Cyanobacteriota bacterium]|nr:hypothetical protein [Cyanobacteriota bacterium]